MDGNKLIAKLSLTPAIHPQGQCCKATFTTEQKNRGHRSILIGYKTPNSTFNNFRVFLSNSNTSSYLNLFDFNMDSPLVFTKGQIKIIKVKVS